MKKPTPLLLVALLAAGCQQGDTSDSAARASRGPQLYRMQDTQTRWASFENPAGAKGQAATANWGAKGSPYQVVKPGESKTLLDVRGSGVIRRIWVTMLDKSPKMLRGMRLDMYWDNATAPAVSVPLGDFFGQGAGQMNRFEGELFSSPTGTSFDCFIPMPFRTAARVVVTNETAADQPCLFYDIDYTLGDKLEADALYFHAHWRREKPTRLGHDFEILPRVAGRGRFLGCSVVVASMYSVPAGVEGEVKVYLDGDTKYPTLAGTGTEDYVGGGWGLDTFSNRYQGCTVAKPEVLAFYRYHVPDPIFFQSDCRVTIQQMTGGTKTNVREMMNLGAPVQVVGVAIQGKGIEPLLETHPGIKPEDAPEGFLLVNTTFDVSATAYFYLDRPENRLAALAPVSERGDGKK
jgi:hypothetical protein